MSGIDPLRTFRDLFILRFMTGWRLTTLLAFSVAFVATSGAAPAGQNSGAVHNISVQRAIDRGKAMYLYDRAGWVTSDDLVTSLPRERHPEIGGWVVTPSTNGLHVDYFGKNDAADQVIYAADVYGGAVHNSNVYPATAAPTLKEPAFQMARALSAAWAEMSRRAEWQPCAKARFNTIVLPPEKDGAVSVYFLTPQTETGNFPFGGHYEVDISRDGKTAASRAFTRSCISMTKPPTSGGAKPAALFLTHILDPHPTEIHVFQQYYVGIPIFVGTGSKSIWKVENGRIDDVSATIAR